LPQLAYTVCEKRPREYQLELIIDQVLKESVAAQRGGNP